MISTLEEQYKMAFTNIRSTQNEFLVDHLRGTGRTLTARQAESLYAVRNLRARMSELRNEGYRVRTTIGNDGRARYAVSRRMNDAIWN